LYSQYERKLARQKKLEDAYGKLKIKKEEFDNKFESLLAVQNISIGNIAELDACSDKLMIDYENIETEYKI
jgi:hypothetical protein